MFVLFINFGLNLLVVKYIGLNADNSPQLTDIYTLIGAAQLIQFGVPVMLAAQIARHDSLSSEILKVTNRITLFVSAISLVISYMVFSNVFYVSFFIPFIVIINNYRGILEGRGAFWESFSIKLLSSSIILWILLLIQGTIAKFSLVLCALVISVWVWRIIQQDSSNSVKNDRRILPFVIQSGLVFSLIFIDRLIIKVISVSEGYVTFVLMQEVVFRPVSIITIFATLHFQQLNSKDSAVIVRGLRNYFSQLLVAFILIIFIVQTGLVHAYLAFFDIFYDFSDALIGATWMALIFSIYLQRITLSFLSDYWSLYSLITTGILSLFFGIFLTSFFQSAVYSLLGRAMLEILVMLFFLLLSRLIYRP